MSETSSARLNIGVVCYPTYGGSGVVASALGMAMAQTWPLSAFYQL